MLNGENNIESHTGDACSRRLYHSVAVYISQISIASILLSLARFKYKIVNNIVDTIIFYIIKHVERSKIQTQGIYKYHQHKSNDLNNLSLCSTSCEIPINTRKPVLLFIHGTISSSTHGFSDLWRHAPKGYIKKLLRPYGQQIFFLDHYTISTSPVENTLMIAKFFPKHTKFHIISHSRGGIIGELLCQSGLKRSTNKSGSRFKKTNTLFSEQELSLFKQDPRRKADYEGLKQLQEIFLEKKFHVERFIRIAAPMRGTALSSESIDEVVTRVFNTLHAIPIPRILGIRNFLASIAFTFIKKARSVEMMPGIESMMPNSPLISLLNRKSVQLQGELSVIAGESTATGLIPRLKHQWLSQYIFKEAHDYVINISAAYGGCLRAEGASRYYLSKNDRVGHFNYFQHESILQRILDALSTPLGTLATFTPFSTMQFKPTAAVCTTENKTNSLKPHWLNLAKRYCDAVSRSMLNANGLVANIQNKLFYIPRTVGWQPYSTGRKVMQVFAKYSPKSGSLNNIQLLCHIGTSRSITHTKCGIYQLNM